MVLIKVGHGHDSDQNRAAGKVKQQDKETEEGVGQEPLHAMFNCGIDIDHDLDCDLC